jgi:hypothetical protein
LSAPYPLCAHRAATDHDSCKFSSHGLFISQFTQHGPVFCVSRILRMVALRIGEIENAEESLIIPTPP